MRIPTRSHLTADGGFTLIEMLVVVLIVAILAAIALPLFVSQRARAQDAKAQATVRTVATALRTHQVNEDSFDATPAQLLEIEPTIAEATPALSVSGTDETYSISETSKSGTTFTLSRAVDGELTRTCSTAGRGLCRSDLHW